jgi:hypothetical protein
MSEQTSSGLSQQAFCARHDLGLSRFGKWKCLLDGVDVSQQSTPSFVELPLRDGASPPSYEIELDLGEGMHFRFRRG